ncbi:MAG: DUF1801 domain-containing protein [Ginsengibacter sp.]
MKKLPIQTSPEVEIVFNKYPGIVRKKIVNLRRLVLAAANEIQGIKGIQEILKWGEPSYIVEGGSTIRIDWKKKTPDQYAIYFKCTSKLVPTFKMVYKDTFIYEGHRAIVFQMNDEIPEVELKSCLTAALMYHKVKHLPMLGL